MRLKCNYWELSKNRYKVLGGNAMAKEAIEAVKTAEEKAKKILEEVNQNSRDLLQEAKEEAEQKYQKTTKEARDEGEKLKEKALLEGESISKPIIEKGKKQAIEIAALTDEDVDSAVNFIIERIVNTNGNS